MDITTKLSLTVHAINASKLVGRNCPEKIEYDIIFTVQFKNKNPSYLVTTNLRNDFLIAYRLSTQNFFYKLLKRVVNN